MAAHRRDRSRRDDRDRRRLAARCPAARPLRTAARRSSLTEPGGRERLPYRAANCSRSRGIKHRTARQTRRTPSAQTRAPRGPSRVTRAPEALATPRRGSPAPANPLPADIPARLSGRSSELASNENAPILKTRKPEPQRLPPLFSPLPGARIKCNFSCDGLRVELLLQSPDQQLNAQRLAVLTDRLPDLQAALGTAEPLRPEPLEGKTQSRVAVYRPGSIDQQDQWQT